MVYKFTKRAEKAIEIASQIATEFGHSYIGTEHLLYGLVKEGEGVAYKVLENQGVTEERNTGNTDFAKAEETIKKALDEMHMEEIEKFIEMFLPAYTKTLDEISK